MNAAARLVTGIGKYEHITPVLRNVLHWLPVSEQIIFKIAVLAFNCICGTVPAYFNDVCLSLADIPGGASLLAAERGELFVPSTRTTIGSQIFRLAAPSVWNSLPQHLHVDSLSQQQFKNGLKAHLFKVAYC
jgi:hypothetical protein